MASSGEVACSYTTLMEVDNLVPASVLPYSFKRRFSAKVSPCSAPFEYPSEILRHPPRNRLETIIEEASSSIGQDNNLLETQLVQTINENEKRVMEEQDSDLSSAKLRKRMIACPPRMFDIVLLAFHSLKRSVATKEEVVQKIIANHIDVIDRREVEEQLTLLKEILPEWISEVVASSGDVLLRINKLRSTDELRKTFAQAV